MAGAAMIAPFADDGSLFQNGVDVRSELNPTAPARCKAVGQPFQADAVYLVCAKPGG